jgi:hypothetical protein
VFVHYYRNGNIHWNVRDLDDFICRIRTAERFGPMTFTMKEERELKKSLRLCVYVSRYVCVFLLFIITQLPIRDRLSTLTSRIVV